MSSPSAPAATAARATAAMPCRTPTPCDGSAKTGRCESLFSIGMALMSKVLRVIVSNVRIPRSQRTTWRLPRATMYSAAISISLRVALIPRLRRTGRRSSPTASSSEKFCMLRAPICSISAPSATIARLSTSLTSVTTGRPVTARASPSSFSPSAFRPWNS